MKQTMLLFAILLMVNQLSNAQSVTLATSTTNPTKGTFVYNNGTNQLQYWNGTAWIPITNAASGTGWALSGTNIYNNNTGNVGIGANPAGFNAKLNVITGSGSHGFLHSNNSITISSYIGSFNGFFGTTSNHPLILMSNFGSQLTILPNGYIGVGNATPANKFQIGSVGSTGYNSNDFVIGNGSEAVAINQTGTVTQIVPTTDISLKPRGNGVGYVGINVDNPTNKLQVGAVTNAFVGNDIAIGNGTNTMSMYQSNTSAKISSTTDIHLNPRNNGTGRVGINTESPRAPLEVASNVSYYTGYTYDYVSLGAAVNGNGVRRCNDCTAYISIYASNAVYATEFDAYSDARIKDIIGVSNSAIDLETIKALQITDYTMKDKIKNSNKPYKKVIAQQLEKFYPQAVNKSTEVVPDIYALSEKVVFDEINKTLKCSLSKSYDLKVGEKIEFVHAEKGKLKAEVIDVSDNSFTVKDWQYPTDKIFVYGREVNDFRTVDYEAISMLGISAIQQLAKENEDLKSKMKSYENRLDALEALLIKSQPGK